MKEWIERSSDKKRKACVERVANVNGKKSRICRAVDNLSKAHRQIHQAEWHQVDDLAVWDTALQSSHAFITQTC